MVKHTIGETAKMLVVTPAALRHYEKRGLIVLSSKTESGYRVYDDQDVHRIRFIKRAQSYGLTLSDIKQLLVLITGSTRSCKSIHDLLAEKKYSLESNITESHAILHALEGLINKCIGGKTLMQDCQIIKLLDPSLKEEPL